jgi:Flp pilus assembly protein protease CpaA
VHLALIGFSIYISCIDLKSHKIGNQTLLFALSTLSTLSIIQSQVIHLRIALIILLVSPILLKLSVGAGDIKLFMVLAIFFAPSSLKMVQEFTYVFCAIAALVTVICALKERSIQGNIALAPAICGAFIWCAS